MKRIFLMLFFVLAINSLAVADDLVELRKSAEQGNAQAQTNLGVAYINGEGIQKDEAQAISWFRKAAEQGNAEAQYNLGGIYINGIGVKKDKDQALTWFRKAAEQGIAQAQLFVAGAYLIGVGGVEKDITQSLIWERKAAEQGNAQAQTNLGLAYYNGEGIAKDQPQGIIWLRKAAEQGYAMAQYNLGLMYFQGKGIEKDEAQAITWFHKAAEQGYADAQAALKEIEAYAAKRDLDKVRKTAEQENIKTQENTEAQDNNNVSDKSNTVFMQGTPNCDDDKVKAWLIKQTNEAVKNVNHSDNIRLVLNKYIFDVNKNTQENEEFMKVFNNQPRNIKIMTWATLSNVVQGKVDANIGYDILNKLKSERIISQVLQEIDTADANLKIDSISLSAIRTKSKNDSIKKVFCITNVDKVINGENNQAENINYTAQITEDSLLYMELLGE